MNVFIDDVLRGLTSYSTIIFILLGLGFFIYLVKFIKGLREWQGSVFGLERDLAQRKLVSASTGLSLLLILLIGEFLLITTIVPRMSIVPDLSARSIDPLVSPTSTLSTALDQVATAPLSSPVVIQENLLSECIDDVLEISIPEEGTQVSGTVELIGSVNVDNFGSYKYEYSTTGTINWVTIAAGNQLKLNESLGFWYTSELPPGPYLIKLAPLNNLGEELTPCIITVEVVIEE